MFLHRITALIKSQLFFQPHGRGRKTGRSPRQFPLWVFIDAVPPLMIQFYRLLKLFQQTAKILRILQSRKKAFIPATFLPSHLYTGQSGTTAAQIKF